MNELLVEIDMAEDYVFVKFHDLSLFVVISYRIDLRTYFRSALMVVGVCFVKCGNM